MATQVKTLMLVDNVKMSEITKLTREEILYFPFREELRNALKLYFNFGISEERCIERLLTLKDEVKSDEMPPCHREMYSEGIENTIRYISEKYFS